MPISLSVQGRRRPPLPGLPGLSAQIEREAGLLLDLLGLSAAELSIVLCDDAQIRALNARWRGKDAPTDVLSFAMREGEAMPDQAALSEAEGEVLGDLIISLDTAARQAREQGHGLAQEARVLLIHGLLHLLGHDHLQPEERAKMQAEEVRLLARLGEAAPGLIARAGG